MTTDNRKIQLGVEVDATGARTGFEQVKQGARDMATATSKSGTEASKGIEKIGESAERSAEKLNRSERSMVASIQRSQAALSALQKGGTESARFESLIDARGLDPAKFAPYVEKLKELEAQTKRTAITSREMAFALRGVPAQFTDIVTSLQGGQAPLTVLLQQGGQLKDMFGGVGNAARAMGGYVLGLINPFSVAAASAVTLGVAYEKGQAESLAFAKALITTGNAAGASVSQLQALASTVSQATGGTQGGASEVIAKLAESGRVVAETMGVATEAAIAFERSGGGAIENTIKQFVELGKSPAEASAKLNEQYNYLTGAIYEQIKALEDQGKVTEAAALAQRSYADALVERSKEIEGKLGNLQLAWRGVADAAKGAWDWMLNVGREDGLETQLNKAREDLTSGWYMGSEKEKRLEITVLEAAVEAEQKRAAAAGQRAKTEQASIAWQQQGAEFLTKRERMEKEIAKSKELGRQAGLDEEAITKRIAAIKEKYFPPEKAKSNKFSGTPEWITNDAPPEWTNKIESINRAREKMVQARETLEEAFAKSNEKFAQRDLSQSDRGYLENLRGVEDAAKKAADAIRLEAKGKGESAATSVWMEEELGKVTAALERQRKAVKEQKDEQDALNKSWEYGAGNALTKYLDQVQNVAAQTESLMSNAFKGMEDALVEFTMTGKLNFASLAESIVRDMIRIQIQQQITGPLAQMGSNFLGGLNIGTAMQYGTNIGSQQTAMLAAQNAGFANGGVFAGGTGLSAYTNTIVSSPTLFKFANGGAFRTGLMGEAGAEAVMPLTRINGKLGVQSSGSGVVVNVINNADGTKATASERQDGNTRIIDVMVEQIKTAVAGDIARGNGPVGGAIERTYGLNRTAGAY